MSDIMESDLKEAKNSIVQAMFEVFTLCVCVCASYPILSEVGVIGTLLGSGCTVFLCRSHSTSYFHHPDRDKRNLVTLL